MTPSALTFNSSDGLYEGSILITNSSKSNIAGDLLLVLKGLTSGVSLSTASITINGITTILAITQDSPGDPVITIPKAVLPRLLKGQSIKLAVGFTSSSATVNQNSGRILRSEWSVRIMGRLAAVRRTGRLSESPLNNGTQFQRPARRVVASPKRSSFTPMRSMSDRYRLQSLRLSSPLVV